MHRRGPTTARLILRAFEPQDAEALFLLNADPVVMRHTGEAVLSSVAQAERAIANYPDWEDPGYGRWACVLRQDGERGTPIGFCGLKYLADLGEVDVGYRLRPEYWGRGLATEAAQASLDFGFRTLALETIAGFVLPANAASIRVLHKLGMTHTNDITLDGLQAQRWTVTRAAWLAHHEA